MFCVRFCTFRKGKVTRNLPPGDNRNPGRVSGLAVLADTLQVYMVLGNVVALDRFIRDDPVAQRQVIDAVASQALEVAMGTRVRVESHLVVLDGDRLHDTVFQEGVERVVDGGF